MTTIVPVLIASAVGIVIGTIIFLIWKKLDKGIDDFQRQVNYIENAFAQWGASWMSEFLADIVVGDEESIIRKIRDFIHADNKRFFLIEKIALPITKFVLREFNSLPPTQQQELEQILAASKFIKEASQQSTQSTNA